MSSGSYNYLSCTADESASELLESRGDVAQMLQCLRQLEYATQAAQVTESLLKELDEFKQLLAQSEPKIQLNSQSLMEVWQAVEDWDSRDWSEQRVREAIANFYNNK
ncbi:MAG: hypothetical protein N4J56_006751 [Chroococcidiopsis sp. SAG 2025]|uniref:hypothetical protein n=1 Tax=Chroococcidiopsis sp. SAG 2025 TaxID=171389 RepID=UPI002936D635|nr:hypothetical protein [Chroococcidiopsis sp. SAG 2025]MDV2997046.1 hypothetical protein [Chroococcidiopsis sp. SAG 2025]